MNGGNKELQMEKLETGVPGFDHISKGGLPKGRATLAGGTSGSGKSVLASQFLAEGITKANENGVFVTFEESPEDIREFTIDNKGMHIGKPFRNITGIISGSLKHVESGEIERINSLFKEE